MVHGDGATDLGRFAVATGLMGLGEIVAAAVEAERAGAESVLIGESPLDADAVVASAAVLGATTRIRVGPGVAGVSDRHPVTLARAAATLDRLAPGRVHLGLGRGDRDAVAGVLGLPYAGAGALEDAVLIARGLLAGRRVDHDGTRWSAHAGPLPARSRPAARVPVLLAAVGPRALRIAGRHADGVLLNYGASPAYVSWALERVAEGATEAGRDPTSVDVMGWMLVARTDAPDAGAQVAAVAAVVEALRGLTDQGAVLGDPDGGLPSRLDGPGLGRVALVGDRQAILARLEQYRAAGLRCAVLLPAGLRALTAP